MIAILFGPPGSGKGTQAFAIAQRLGVPHISTGEMFRAECQAGTPLGRRARAILAQGGLIGDEIVNAMVAGRIERSDCRGGFLLDGYPRTLAQAKFFSKLLDQRGLREPFVIHIDVPQSELVARLKARWQCPRCLHIYNLRTQPPKVDGICDTDGAKLIHDLAVHGNDVVIGLSRYRRCAKKRLFDTKTLAMDRHLNPPTSMQAL